MPLPQTFDAFVPSNFGQLVARANFKPTYISLEELKTFDAIAVEFQKSYELSKKLYPEVILSHCVRMYYYSLAILHSGFPSNTPLVPQITREELIKRVYLGVILHDLGLSTHAEAVAHPAHEMTFEFSGGIMAYEHLQTYGPSLNTSQVGDITQSIMLHTSPFDAGMSSATAMLVQLSALFDLGGYSVLGDPNLDCMLHQDTVKEIRDAVPKGQFAEFSEGISKMMEAQPNCLMSHKVSIHLCSIVGECLLTD